MIKRIVFIASLAVNAILAIVMVVGIVGAAEELEFTYVEKETIRPDSINMYLDMENYGTVAALSHSVRGGAEIKEEYAECFAMGEYADLLFQRRIFEADGDEDTLKKCDERLSAIRADYPGQSSVFDKMDSSVEKAVME